MAVDTYLTRELIRLSLEEDAPNGDCTSECTVPEEKRARGQVVARERLFTCGSEFLPVFLSAVGEKVTISKMEEDGVWVPEGSILCCLEATARTLLRIERPLLNFMQRLSGVASYTQEVVASAAGVVVLDTRKTMPGYRQLDKYATRVGGARNHRFSLSDMILVKNNHMDVHDGDVARTLESIVVKRPWYTPFEVEVRTLEELKAALPFKPTAVLLDNMKNDEIAECLRVLADRSPETLVEVSGGISGDRILELKQIGVKAVSMGSLTTQAPNRDISMRITVER
jgi:nicotinate-nucleotide pyrophosphorylase (carboxylating)